MSISSKYARYVNVPPPYPLWFSAKKPPLCSNVRVPRSSTSFCPPLNRQFYLHKPINPLNHWKRKDVTCFFHNLYNFIAINPNWLAQHSSNCTSFVFYICITWRILICISLFTMTLYCSSPYIEPPVIYALKSTNLLTCVIQVLSEQPYLLPTFYYFM